MESTRPRHTIDPLIIYRNIHLIISIILLATLSLLVPKYALADATKDRWQITPEPSWGSQAKIITTDTFDGSRFYNVVEKQRRHEKSAVDSINYYRYVYTIKNDSGVDESAPITVEFDPVYERVQLHQVVIHRNGKKINQLIHDKVQVLQRETQLENGLYDGNQTLHLLLNDQRVGDQIEYSFSIIGNNPVFDGHVFGWARLQASVPVGNYYFRLRYPAGITVNTRTYAGDVNAVRTLDKGYQQLTWEQTNTTGSEYQSNVPSSYIAQTTIQYSDFSDWSEVAAWAGPLYEPDNETSEAVKLQADQIKLDWPSQEQQIEAAIGFVQDKIRYTGINSGIGGFKPDTAEQILHRRYGDCKDKATLLVALLKEFGVTAYPALVHSYEGYAIPDYLPSPDAFNHMIVKLPDHKGKTYWIDGTMTLQGSKLENLYQGSYEHALVPAQHTKGLQSYTGETLERPTREVLEQYTLYNNNELDDSTLTVTSKYRGRAAESMRRTVQGTGKRKLQSSYLGYYENRFETIAMSQPLEIHDDRPANELTTIEHYIITDAWEKSDEHSNEQSVSYFLSVHADTITSQLSTPSDRRRHQPLIQNHPVNVSHQIELTTADGWGIEDSHDEIENDYFRYNSSSVVNGETLTLNYRLVTTDRIVSVADSRRYIKDLKKTLNDPYYEVWFEFSVAAENLQNLENQLSSIGTWFKQTAEALASAER